MLLSLIVLTATSFVNDFSKYQSVNPTPTVVVQSEILKPIIIKEVVVQVPFYSQFVDITSPTWKKVGCGITSLAMIIDYYRPAVPVDTLLKQGITAGAYLDSAGWTYSGLISVARRYGLDGNSYDLARLGTDAAFTQFKTYLEDGPVIASIHYKFNPKSPIPHLVVINKIINDTIYYNDPAAKTGDKQISVSDFEKAWKMRFIVIRPALAEAKV